MTRLNNGVRVRALMPITNVEDDRQYMAGEEFTMYRPVAEVRELMRQCFVEILDGEESPAVVVNSEVTDGSNW